MRTTWSKSLLGWWAGAAFVLAVAIFAFYVSLPARMRAGERSSAQNASGAVPTPASVLGFEPGSPRTLATSAQVRDYFTKLDAASDRMRMIEIGKSVSGQPLQMAIIASEETLRDLDRYRDIARRLAQARGLTDDEARKLARAGKSIIWIDHGLHATEAAQPEAAMLLAHRLVTSEEDDIRRIRERTIVLLPPNLNPDGRERVLAWYNQQLGTPFERTQLPYLDHPYFGHENNRDGFMISTPEVQAIARTLWHEWFPQIMVNHHQGAPFPSRIFIPPYQEAVNPNIPALVVRGMSVVGTTMGLRFEEEGKTGVISRASYTLWSNGPLRASANFHNQVGILVEVQMRPAHWGTTGTADPATLPKKFSDPTTPVGMTASDPSVFYTSPWKGGDWTFRDQVDYFVTASLGAADAASKAPDEWLFNMYRMGKEAIATGTRGGPFAYVIPPEQWDGSEANELVNLLQRGAIEVHRTTAAFQAAGKSYPIGSYVAYAAQPFRAHLVDLMDVQRHPDLRQFPGGPPIPPYDGAGWTVPMAMGVQVDRIEQPFTVAATKLTGPERRSGRVDGIGPAYLLTSAENGSYRAINALWSAQATIARATAAFSAAGTQWPAGTFIVRGARETMASVAAAEGVRLVSVDEGTVKVPTTPLPRPTIGLYQSYVVHGYHNPDEGWTRWILEQYGFKYRLLHDADIRKGDLAGVNAIILPDQEQLDDILDGHKPGTMPPAYTGGLGAEGTAALKAFVQDGGTLVALDQASSYAIDGLGLPIANAAKDVPTTKLFVPGSFLRTQVDTTQPIAYGMPKDAAAMYYRRRSAAHMSFKATGAGAKDVQVVARYAPAQLLMTGWEVGADEYLGGTPAVAQVGLGRGRVVLFNFRPQFRNQARGTFKLLFNAMLTPRHEATSSASR